MCAVTLLSHNASTTAAAAGTNAVAAFAVPTTMDTLTLTYVLVSVLYYTTHKLAPQSEEDRALLDALEDRRRATKLAMSNMLSPHFGSVFRTGTL